MNASKKLFLRSIGFVPISVGLYMLTGLSPIWHFLGLHRAITLVISFVALLIASAFSLRKIPFWYFYFSSITLSLSMFVGFYWSSVRVGIYSVYFLMSLLIILVTSRSEFDKTINLLTPIIFIILIGAWIGSVYAFLGGEPLVIFQNPDSRNNALFLTTLSNAAYQVLGNLVIRSAGIYDEPGTFSFVIAALSTVRHFQNKNNLVTLTMLLMGFVTLSFAHLVYFLVYMIALLIDRKRFRLGLGYKRLVSLIVLLGTVGIFLSLTPAGYVVQNTLLSRLAVTEDGTVAGDNRSDAMLNAAESLNFEVFVWGIDPICTSDAAECQSRHGAMANNPLSPLVFRGLLVSAIYYICLLTFLFLGITSRKYFILVGIFLLFLQRPTIMSPGYDIWAVAILYSAISSYKLRKIT